MTQEDLQEAVRIRPFEPFRVVLTTGDRYEIPHPELIMVGRRAAIIGIPRDPTSTVFERTIKVDLLHIVGIEEIPASPASSNGAPS